MKSITLFLSVAILSTTNLFSQEEKYDVIEYYEVSVNQVPMVSKKAVVIKKIGKPDSIKRENGIEDIYWFNYYYKRSSLQIDPEGDFMGFNISDSSFSLTFKSTNIKIGESANALKILFPKSYKRYTTTKTKYFRIKIKDTDSYILFTIKSDIVTQVHTWDDNT